MTTAQAGERWGIVSGNILRIAIAGSEETSGQQARAGGYGYAVEKITPRDGAVHAQITVSDFVVAHESLDLRYIGRREEKLTVSFLDGEFRSLESNATVRAIAERFIDRSTAAAEGKCWLTGEIVRSSVDVDEFDGTFRSFHPEWTIGTDSDFDLSHDYKFLQPCAFIARIKDITEEGRMSRRSTKLLDSSA
jgi:hypothetical protein